MFVNTFRRALLRLKGEETTTEILEKFLGSYITILKPNTPNGSSPAEAKIKHKIWLHVDIIHPTLGTVLSDTSPTGLSKKL